MKYLGRISDPKDLVTKEYVDNGLGDKANTSDLASVATSGSYDDLSDTPTSVSEFTNDSGYQTYDGVYSIAASIASSRYTDSEKQKLGNIDSTKLSAIASGASVGANGTESVVKSYPGATSKMTTTSIGSASGWNAGTTPSLGTAISADDITAWSSGSHNASIQSSVLIDASISGGTLTISSGSQSHSYTPPSLSYTSRSIPNVTSVGTTPSLTVTETTVATGSLSSSSSGASVMTGLGTANTATVLTGVKMTAQPSVTINNGTTGDVEVAVIQ